MTGLTFDWLEPVTSEHLWLKVNNIGSGTRLWLTPNSKLLVPGCVCLPLRKPVSLSPSFLVLLKADVPPGRLLWLPFFSPFLLGLWMSFSFRVQPGCATLALITSRSSVICSQSSERQNTGVPCCKGYKTEVAKCGGDPPCTDGAGVCHSAPPSQHKGVSVNAASEKQFLDFSDFLLLGLIKQPIYCLHTTVCSSSAHSLRYSSVTFHAFIKLY